MCGVGRRYAAPLLLQDTPSAISLIAALWYHKFSFLLHFCYAWYRCYTLRSTSSKIVSIMVSQIHIFFTLFTLWSHCYSLRSNISKIVTIMVSLYSHFTFTCYIMVSLCRNNQKVAKWRKCIISYKKYTFPPFRHLLVSSAH